jgi:hypothetical protein
MTFYRTIFYLVLFVTAGLATHSVPTVRRKSPGGS